MANLEKQNEKLEKQNQKLKKKNKRGGTVILILILIIVILAAVIFLFDPLGFGNGMGILKGGSASGEAGGNSSVTTTAPEQTSAVNEQTAPAPVTVEIRVSGATYLMDGAETTVDDIVAAAKNVSGEVIVKITDDSATANAMDALTAALEKDSIQYTIG